MSEQLDPKTLNELRVRLEKRRAELAKELDTPAADVRDASEGREPGDLVDSATDDVLRRPEEAIRDKHRQELALIDQALHRIADGSYGKGADGRSIPVERLKAIPWATS